MIPYFQRGLRFMAWAETEKMNALASCPASQSEALPLMAHLPSAEHVRLQRIGKSTPVAHLARMGSGGLQGRRPGPIESTDRFFSNAPGDLTSLE